MICRKKRIVSYLGLSIALLFCFVPQVHADPVNCTVDEEVIVKMRAPDFGDSGMWKVHFGEDERNERFVSGLALPDWETLVIGESVDKAEDAAATEETTRRPTLIMTKLNHRGRTIWAQTHKIENLQGVVKILSYEDGFLIFGNIQPAEDPAYIWMGKFDQKGNLVSESVLKENQANIWVVDAAVYDEKDPNNKQKSALVLAAQYKHTKTNFPRHARLYMLDKNLRMQSHRAFVTGTENIIKAVAISPEMDMIMAAGYAIGNDGRYNGWILNLGGGGNIRWQRQFPRGAGSQLNTIAPYYNDTLLAGGTAVPLNDSPHAGWLMRIDTNSGEAMWQRYFTGDMNYNAQDMRVNKDGVISLMMNATATKKAPATDFVRMLNVSSNGYLLRHDAYFNGEGAHSYELLEGTRGEHIIVGEAVVPYLKDNPDPNAGPENQKIPDRSREGWVIVGRKAQQYNDPCLKDEDE